jgi:hypothetical protein
MIATFFEIGQSGQLPIFDNGRKKPLSKAGDTVNQVLIDQAVEELDRREGKLRTYFDHFDIEARYGIGFPEFVRRVEAGTWEAYLAS